LLALGFLPSSSRILLYYGLRFALAVGFGEAISDAQEGGVSDKLFVLSFNGIEPFKENFPFS